MPNILQPYVKPFQSCHQICCKLKTQGLGIADVKEAERTLARYSYYRFKAYLLPFKNNKTKTYNHGATLVAKDNTAELFSRAYELEIFS